MDEPDELLDIMDEFESSEILLGLLGDRIVLSMGDLLSASKLEVAGTSEIRLEEEDEEEEELSMDCFICN